MVKFKKDMFQRIHNCFGEIQKKDKILVELKKCQMFHINFKRIIYYEFFFE